MKIGISGASGQLGQEVVAELARRNTGDDIVAISRTPDRLAIPVEGRFGDYDAPQSLAQAYAGIDRLLLIPSAEIRPGARSKQLVDAIDAAVAAGVQHIFLVSAAGTRLATEAGLREAYWTSEQHLIRNAPAWTILRMNYFAESMAQEIQMSLGMGALAGLGEERVAYVSRDDLAAAAAGALTSDGHAGAFYNLTGPAALSGAERAHFAWEITGKPIAFTVTDEASLRTGLEQGGMPAQFVDAIIEIKHSFVAGAYDIVTGDVARLSGRQPRSLHAILANALQH